MLPMTAPAMAPALGFEVGGGGRGVGGATLGLKSWLMVVGYEMFEPPVPLLG